MPISALTGLPISTPYLPGYTPPTFNYGPGSTSTGTTGLGDLASYINSINRQGQTAANQARIPGAVGLEAQSSANIGSELQGQLPADVLRLIQQQGAERGVATGSPGSPNSNAAYLQALGLTSLDLTQRGQQNLTGAYARNPAAPLFDPTTQLLTPYQSGTLNLEGGRLALEQQTEADRVALEQRRLDQEAALRGGGGGGGGGRGGTPATALPSDITGYGGEFVATAAPTGPTASALASSYGTDPTQSWWANLGVNQLDASGNPIWPMSTAPTGTGTFSAGGSLSDVGAWYDSLFNVDGSAAGAPAASDLASADQSGFDYGSFVPPEGGG
jgi:hypothetical protein